MTAHFCIRCGDCHSDDSPICSTCSYAESPADLLDVERLSGPQLAPPLAGWVSNYHGADAIERLERALEYACEALRTVGNDYPGSSCCEWCHASANEANEIAAGRGQ